MLSILKSPMILMGIVTMGIVFGMPYLMDNSTFYTFSIPFPLPLLLICIYLRVYHNHGTIKLTPRAVDPELRAEFEERQKESPLNAIMGNAQAGQNPLGNFDMAAYLAGSGKKEGVKR